MTTHLWKFGIAAVCLTAIGCGPPPKQAGSGDDFEVKWDDSSDPGEGSSSSSGSGESGESGEEGETAAPLPGTENLDEDQKAQIQVALRRGSEKAAQCPSVVPDSPEGTGEVSVTFDGVKGRAVAVEVGAPFGGTPVEACIKRAFVDEIVLPFDGGPIQVPSSVELKKKK